MSVTLSSPKISVRGVLRTISLIGSILIALDGVATIQDKDGVIGSLPSDQADGALTTLATDAHRGRLFAVSPEAVWTVDVDGNIEAHWPLDDLGKDLGSGTTTGGPTTGGPAPKADVLARVLPHDGSLWVARGPHLEAYSAFGLWRRDLDGEPQLTRALNASLNTITVDATGTLWGLQGEQVVRFDDNSEAVSEHRPLTEDRPLRLLVSQPSKSSVGPIAVPTSPTARSVGCMWLPMVAATPVKVGCM